MPARSDARGRSRRTRPPCTTLTPSFREKTTTSQNHPTNCPYNRGPRMKDLPRNTTHAGLLLGAEVWRTLKADKARKAHPNCSSRSSVSSVGAVDCSMSPHTDVHTRSKTLRTDVRARETRNSRSVGGKRLVGRGRRQKWVDEYAGCPGTGPTCAAPPLRFRTHGPGRLPTRQLGSRQSLL